MRGIDGAATLAAYRVMQVSLHLGQKVPFCSCEDVDASINPILLCDRMVGHATGIPKKLPDLISLGKFVLFKGKLL
jgi:hypothetical protein